MRGTMAAKVPGARRSPGEAVHVVVEVDGVESRGGLLEAGLQDISGELDPGRSGADGLVRYEADLTVRRRADGTVSYAGHHVHGPAKERFLYLSYRRPGAEPTWVRRVKILLPLELDDGVRELRARIRDRRVSRAEFIGDGWTAVRAGSG
jgi:hypothetical protein